MAGLGRAEATPSFGRPRRHDGREPDEPDDLPHRNADRTGAIVMWSLLAALTVATGRIPAFQLAAMTFAIAAVGCLTWIGRWRRFLPCGSAAAWIVGSAGCSAITRCISWRCACAAAEAGLLNYLWPC